MKNLIVFVLCVHLARSDLAPDDGSLEERLEPRLTFDWTSPLSLLITNTRGEQEEMELRPAPGIGGVEVECSFDGFLQKNTKGSAAVLGCQNSTEVTVVIVSNFTQGTMFTFYPHKQTIIELMDSVNGNKEEGTERMKRSSYTDPEDDYIDDDNYFSFVGAKKLPANLYFRLGVGYDKAFLRKMGDKRQAEEYINTIITLSRPFYKQTSLGTNLHFVFNEEIRFLEGQEYQINPYYKGSGARLTANDAKSIPTSEPLIIFTHTDDTEDWRGIAIQRGGCDSDISLGRAITKWRSVHMRAARTLVHEQGHLFGKYHDEDEDKKNAKRKNDMDKTSLDTCQGKGVMTDLPINIPILPNEKSWSDCSQARFLKWYTRFGNACLNEAVPCNNGAWTAPCSCGDGPATNLCLSEESGYCHLPTSTCTVKETHVKKTLKDIKNTCTSFTAPPGDPLKSGCSHPQELVNGLFVCLQNGNTCFANCHPGYTLETSHRFMECVSDQWSPPANTFTCVLDCQYGDNSGNPACTAEVLWTGPSPSQTFELPDFTFVDSGCQVADPAVDKYPSVFQEIQGAMYTCSHTGCKQYVQEENTWETIQGNKFVSERENAAGTVVGNGGKWLVQGGRVSVNGWTNVATAEVWSPGTGHWVEDPQYTSPLPVHAHCLVNLNGKVMQIGGHSYALGGYTSRCFLDGQEVASLKAPRGYHACAVFQDQVWVAGGGRDGGDHGAVEFYDQAKKSWRDGPKRPMTTPDDMPQLLVYQGQLYYIGGSHIGKIYKLEQNNWKEVADIQKGDKVVSVVMKKPC